MSIIVAVAVSSAVTYIMSNAVEDGDVSGLGIKKALFVGFSSGLVTLLVEEAYKSTIKSGGSYVGK